MNSRAKLGDYPQYWEIIQCNAAGFLTLNPTYESRLYRGTIRPSVKRDAVRGLRGGLGGTMRSLQGLVFSCLRFSAADSKASAYLLLITFGGTKYAGEESEILEACHRRGVVVRTVHLDHAPDNTADDSVVAISSILRPGDHIRILLGWLGAVARKSRFLVGRDAMARSLFIASIPALRQSEAFRVLARRIVLNLGEPTAVLSLAPWTLPSGALVEYLKGRGVPTAGIRTQTTHPELEHLSINTDILFCKSVWERHAYESVFAGNGPTLRDGCVLSLPAPFEPGPLNLPDEYVLVLGSNPPDGAAPSERRQFHDRYLGRVQKVAAAAGLPVVYKQHHPSAGATEGSREFVASGGVTYVFVSDMRLNRKLIDDASLIVSAPSTLLYYAILMEKPIVIVETHPFALLPDEFAGAPIRRIVWRDDYLEDKSLEWPSLQVSARSAKIWMQTNYFLSEGAGDLVDFLLSVAKTSAAKQRPVPWVNPGQ